MYPELFKIGPLTVHTYGLFVAMGFLAGISLAVSRAKKIGLPHNQIADLGFYILLAAIVGSRVLYVFVNFSHFLSSPLDVFKIWEGGLVFYGGFLAAFATAVWYIKKHSLPVMKTLDVYAPSLAIGHALGRIGCFFAGCCYGAPATVPWAVTFTDPQCLAIKGVALHPTQLYESVGEFTIFFILLFVRSRQKFDGQLIWVYGVAYSALRFTVEIFRGDFERGVYGGGISISQDISIGIFLVSLFMLVRGLKKAAPQAKAMGK